MRHDAPSYVERRADNDLYIGLSQGEFCYVLTARQMGKSSLMVRAGARLRRDGVSVVVLDLTAGGRNLTPEQWYSGLLRRVGHQLGLEIDLERFWLAQQRLGPLDRWMTALRHIVLPRLQQEAERRVAIAAAHSKHDSPSSATAPRLVIFVDEIDVVRSLPFSTDEFFAAIRECYNRRAEDPELNRLTFCLLGVATPSDLIRDARITPFNIGRRIQLDDFTPAEAAPLARGLRRAEPKPRESDDGTSEFVRRNSTRLLERVLFWTGGHPYLTQRLCQELAQDESADLPKHVDRLCEELFFSQRARERDDNLLFVREILLRGWTDVASLLDLYLKIRRGKWVVDDETSPLVNLLRLSGIVKPVDGRLRERNRVYERVFDPDWVWTNMPEAERRRQRAAFRLGVFRTAGIASAVVALLTFTVLIAARQATNARISLAVSNLSQAQARRASGVSGQHYESFNVLRQARRYYTNETALRDEAIACLALLDLQSNQVYSLRQTNVFALSPDLGLTATARKDGTITLRHLNNRLILKELPGLGLPLNQLRLGPTNEALLVAEYLGGLSNQTVVWNWQKGSRLFEASKGVCEGAIEFSADGRKLALGHTNGHVVVYSLPSGNILTWFESKLASGFPRLPHVLRFNAAGDRLAESSLDDLSLQIWNLNTTPARKEGSCYHRANIYDIAWRPQGNLLATACGDAEIYLWDPNHDDRPMKKLDGHEAEVTAVAFNQAGTLIASVGLDETLRLWMPATGRQVAMRLEKGEVFQRLQFIADDHLLVAESRKHNHARTWQVFADEYVVLQPRIGPVDKLRNIDFSPDSRLLAAVSGEATTVWDASPGREVAVFAFTNQAWRLSAAPFTSPLAHSAWFSADNRHLVVSVDTRLLQCALQEVAGANHWRLEQGLVETLSSTQRDLGVMALALDRTLAAIVHRDEVLLVSFQGRTNPVLRSIQVGDYYQRLALHPKGVWMAAAIKNPSSIDVWNLSPDAKTASKSVLPSSEYFAFSPDGQWLVTCWAGEFQFYRTGAWGQRVFVIPRQIASTQYAPIAFSRDGATVAVAASRYIIQIFNLQLPKGSREPRLIATLESPDHSPLEMLAFSLDGRRLAAATKDQTIQLWNLALLRKDLAEVRLEQDWPALR